MDNHQAFPHLRRAADELGVEAYAVGGYVRDHLFGRETHDLDVVVGGGRALAMAVRYAELTGAPAPVLFPHFGTAHVSGDLQVEFADARAESYSPDSRKPSVRGASFEEDLLRRDFTVNALLMDFDGRVRDEFEVARRGLADLDARLLRTPADPVATFSDDPLRMMRAARFASQFGMRVDRAALEAMPSMAARLRSPMVSVERVAVELRKLLAGAYPAQGLAVMQAGGLLDAMLPELAAMVGVEQNEHHLYDVWEHTLLVVRGVPAEPVLGLAALFHDVGKPVTADGRGHFYGHEDVGADMTRAALVRLRFPNDEVAAVVKLVRLHMRPVTYRPEDSAAAVRRLVRDAGDQVDDLMLLTRADQDASGEPAGERQADLERRVAAVGAESPSRLELPVTGHDVMRVLGVAPGPEVGRLLRELRERVIEGELLPEREVLLAALRSASA